MKIENELQQKDIEFLKDAISSLRTDMKDGFNSINTKLQIMDDNYVKAEIVNKEFERIDEDIKELRESNKWLFRTIVGTVLTTIIGIIFNITK